MKKVQKRALVAMISATAFFAGFANAADDENKSSNNPNKFNRGTGASASALFKGNVFGTKSGDPENTKQQQQLLLKQQLAQQSPEKPSKTEPPTNPNQKAPKKTKKTGKSWWGSKQSDATDGGRTGSDIRSGSGSDYSDASGTDSSDDENFNSMSVSEMIKGPTPTKKQPTGKAQPQHQKEKTPQVADDLVKHIAAGLSLMLTNKADHQKDEEQQKENSMGLAEGMAENLLDDRYKDIREKLLTINGKKIEKINPHENRLIAILDGRPVSVKAQMVNVGNDEKVAVSILPIRDKLLASMFDENQLIALGKTVGHEKRGDIYKAISAGDITYPLAQEKLESAFIKALDDRGSVEARVLLNPEDIGDATIEDPQIGVYADNAKYQSEKKVVAIKYLQRSLAINKKELGEYKKQDVEYQKAMQQIADKDKTIAEQGQKFKAKNDELTALHKDAQELKGKLREKTKRFNQAKKAYATEKGDTNALDNYAPTSKDGNESDPDA